MTADRCRDERSMQGMSWHEEDRWLAAGSSAALLMGGKYLSLHAGGIRVLRSWHPGSHRAGRGDLNSMGEGLAEVPVKRCAMHLGMTAHRTPCVVACRWVCKFDDMLHVSCPGPSEVHSTIVEHHVAWFWAWVAQPLLFGIVGTAVNFRKIKASTIPLSVAVIFSGAQPCLSSLCSPPWDFYIPAVPACAITLSKALPRSLDCCRLPSQHLVPPSARALTGADAAGRRWCVCRLAGAHAHGAAQREPRGADAARESLCHARLAAQGDRAGCAGRRTARSHPGERAAPVPNQNPTLCPTSHARPSHMHEPGARP